MRPLHWAAYNGDRSAIKALLKKRQQSQADYRAFSFDGQLPIDFAASSQAYDCVDTFLDQFKKEKGYAGGQNISNNFSKFLQEFKKFSDYGE